MEFLHQTLLYYKVNKFILFIWTTLDFDSEAFLSAKGGVNVDSEGIPDLMIFFDFSMRDILKNAYLCMCVATSIYVHTQLFFHK